MIGELITKVVGPLLGPLLDKIPDVNERGRIAADLEKNLTTALTGLVMAQIEVNNTEAQHHSVFVAGWRPAVGWICAAGLGWNFIVQPLIKWIAFLFGADLADAPELNVGELIALLTGMLGLGGYRTYEKQIGKARNKL